MADLRPLHEAGVAGFKCFLLPSGVDEFPPLDPAQLAAAMTEIASFGGLLIAHAEDPAVIAAAPPAHGRQYAGFLASRPPDAEVRAIEALLGATRRTGCRTHIVHLSAAAALPVIWAAKADGLPVTAETCPHYLTLRAEDVPDGGTQFKCCPPVRGEANRAAAVAGAAGRHDRLRRLRPLAVHRGGQAAGAGDARGDFGAAWGGIASVQLGLPVLWTEAARRGIGLGQVAGWLAAAPARLTGLAGRGRSHLVSGPTFACSRRTRPSSSSRICSASAIRSPPIWASGYAGWCARRGWPGRRSSPASAAAS